MKISKKGFTLTEIIIVVAIIVIISGAAIAGVAVTVAQANERGEQMYNLYGEGNWEKDANATIAALKPTLGDEQIDEADVDDPKEGGNTEDQDKLDPTPTPVNPDPTDPPPTDPPPTDPPPTDPPPKTPSGGGTNAVGSSVNINTGEINNWNGNISFDSGVKSVIVSTEDPNFDINAWKYKTTPLGNNQYQITYTADQYQTPDTSIQVRTHGYDLTVVSWSS